MRPSKARTGGRPLRTDGGETEDGAATEADASQVLSELETGLLTVEAAQAQLSELEGGSGGDAEAKAAEILQLLDGISVETIRERVEELAGDR